MRIYTLFIFLQIYTISAFAQVMEIPMEGNPVLQQYTQQQEQQFQEKHANFFKNIVTASSRGNDAEYTCVASGDSAQICIDITGLPIGQGSTTTLQCLDCAGALHGTANMVDDCLKYVTNTGLNFEMDTLHVEVCDTANNCIELEYCFVISRPNASQFTSPIELDAETSAQLTIDVSGLPTAFYECRTGRMP